MVEGQLHTGKCSEETVCVAGQYLSPSERRVECIRTVTFICATYTYIPAVLP